jgi:hypothetical protein
MSQHITLTFSLKYLREELDAVERCAAYDEQLVGFPFFIYIVIGLRAA